MGMGRELATGIAFVQSSVSAMLLVNHACPLWPTLPCPSVYCYVDELKDGFAPWVEATAPRMIKLLVRDNSWQCTTSAAPYGCYAQSIAAPSMHRTIAFMFAFCRTPHFSPTRSTSIPTPHTHPHLFPHTAALLLPRRGPPQRRPLRARAARGGQGRHPEGHHAWGTRGAVAVRPGPRVMDGHARGLTQGAGDGRAVRRRGCCAMAGMALCVGNTVCCVAVLTHPVLRLCVVRLPCTPCACQARS